MKKSERLSQELLYLTDKKIFHLKELEEKFIISERTALRDITDLEQLSLAFYSETGSGGGYYIINSKLLLPIRFNTQGINAIFFVLQAIKNPSGTPYSNEYQKIQTRLLKNLPQKLQNQTSLQKKFIHYISQPSLNEVHFFTLLLKACLNNSVILARNFQFIKEEQKLQLLDMFYQAGNWFCHAYNLDLKRWFVLRLDKFETVKLLNTKQSVMNKGQLLDSFRQYKREHYCIPHQCQLAKIGEQEVEYNSHPIMQIDHEHGKIYLNDKYNKGELRYLIGYLIPPGSEVKVLKLKELKDSYLEKLNEIIRRC